MFQASAAFSIASCIFFASGGAMVLQWFRGRAISVHVTTVLLLCGAWALIATAVCATLGFLGVLT